MNKTERYQQELKNIEVWDQFLLDNSGLPGRRANIELAHAVSFEGDQELFLRYITYDEQLAPTNTPSEFLAFCGTLGLGELLKRGGLEYLATLRTLSNDRRWRIREAVAMALQTFGESNMNLLLEEMSIWKNGTRLEQRASAAAVCEPGLLSEKQHCERVFQILDDITRSLNSANDSRSDDFRVLRKGLGYCWSVAVSACPEKGKVVMERWFTIENEDVRWVMIENLKKKRLTKMDTLWTEEWLKKLR
jgi:hypothetical protein